MSENMDDVVQRLARWWEANDRASFDALAPGLSDAEIEPHERALGAKLPAGLRALYRWRNGVVPGTTFASTFPGGALVSLDAAMRDRARLTGLLDAGNFRTRDWWKKPWLPFLSNFSGDHVCWDPKGGLGGVKGQVISFWHDSPLREAMAPSFDAWLTAYVDALEAGRWSTREDDYSSNLDQFSSLLRSRFAGYPTRVVDVEGKRPTKPAPRPPRVEADATRDVRTYSAQTTFAVGDQVVHPSFGTGVVQGATEQHVVVHFEVGDRTLVHARGTKEQLARPSPVDHTKGRPPF